MPRAEEGFWRIGWRVFGAVMVAGLAGEIYLFVQIWMLKH